MLYICVFVYYNTKKQTHTYTLYNEGGKRDMRFETVACVVE